MKKVTRFLSFLLAIAMVLAMNIGTLTVSAATYSIKIDNTSKGHTYTAYQLFTGTVSNKTLSDVEWGECADSNTSGIITALINAGILTQDASYYTTAQRVADGLAGQDAEAIAEALVNANVLDSTYAHSATSTAAGSTVEITGLESGYYLVTDTVASGASTADEGDVYSAYLVYIVGESITVTTKQDTPTVEKKVEDVNDSTGEETDWQDSADYDIGDTISYKLTATLGSTSGYLDAYDEYDVVFTDTLSKGLTYTTDSVVVKVGTTVISTDSYSISYEAYSGNESTYKDGHVLTVSMDVLDLKDENDVAVSVSPGSVITVEYKCTLNKNAVIGSAGNPNEVYLEYSNNPYDTNEYGKTPKDKVTVFTFELDVNKVKGGTTDPLTGAGFTLYKFVKDDSGSDYVTVANQTSKLQGTWTQVSSEITGVTTFSFEGLDDGYYKIVESTTPSGYNTIDPIYLVVTSAHDEEDDDPQLTALKAEVYNASYAANNENDITLTASGTTYTTSVSAGTISATVENFTGAEMPETGGSGVTLLYIVGGVLVAGAGILLIVKRRMRNA